MIGSALIFGRSFLRGKLCSFLRSGSAFALPGGLFHSNGARRELPSLRGRTGGGAVRAHGPRTSLLEPGGEWAPPGRGGVT